MNRQELHDMILALIDMDMNIHDIAYFFHAATI